MASTHQVRKQGLFGSALRCAGPGVWAEQG